MESNDLELEMFERTANSRRALRNQEVLKIHSACYMLFDDHPEPSFYPEPSYYADRCDYE